MGDYLQANEEMAITKINTQSTCIYECISFLYDLVLNNNGDRLVGHKAMYMYVTWWKDSNTIIKSESIRIFFSHSTQASWNFPFPIFELKQGTWMYNMLKDAVWWFKHDFLLQRSTNLKHQCWSALLVQYFLCLIILHVFSEPTSAKYFWCFF